MKKIQNSRDGGHSVHSGGSLPKFGLVWFSSKEAKSFNLNADLRSHFEGEVDLAGEVVA